uniref:Uncharacterized protein n=1 Tax=Anguilla anguilla TaxID=7936 RepID=A0A0E9QRY7_ANGAN
MFSRLLLSNMITTCKPVCAAGAW